MPYKWKKSKIKLGKYDRRLCGLTDEDKNMIRKLHKENMPIRAIAREYATKCSRRTIIFLLYPERLKKMQEAHKKAKHWKTFYDRSKLTIAKRNWEKYKNNLIKEKKI